MNNFGWNNNNDQFGFNPGNFNNAFGGNGMFSDSDGNMYSKTGNCIFKSDGTLYTQAGNMIFKAGGPDSFKNPF